MSLIDEARTESRSTGYVSAIDQLLVGLTGKRRAEVLELLNSDIGPSATARVLSRHFTSPDRPKGFSENMVARWRRHAEGGAS